MRNSRRFRRFRESIIMVCNSMVAQENRGEQMHLLYEYLTSNTLRMQVEAIVEGFIQMRVNMEKEKNAMQRIWKQSEKNIEKLITNTIDMYSSVKGIAGNAIQEVKALELADFELEGSEASNEV